MSYLCLPVDRPVTYLDIFHSFPYAVSVIVSSSSVSDAAAAKFVEYNILVATKTMSSELTWWSLRKRFSEFEALTKSLRRVVPKSVTLPKLPPKSLKRYYSEEYRTQRARQLEEFMLELLNVGEKLNIAGECMVMDFLEVAPHVTVRPRVVGPFCVGEPVLSPSPPLVAPFPPLVSPAPAADPDALPQPRSAPSASSATSAASSAASSVSMASGEAAPSSKRSLFDLLGQEAAPRVVSPDSLSYSKETHHSPPVPRAATTPVCARVHPASPITAEHTLSDIKRVVTAFLSSGSRRGSSPAHTPKGHQATEALPFGPLTPFTLPRPAMDGADSPFLVPQSPLGAPSFLLSPPATSFWDAGEGARPGPEPCPDITAFAAHMMQKAMGGAGPLVGPAPVAHTSDSGAFATEWHLRAVIGRVKASLITLSPAGLQTLGEIAARCQPDPLAVLTPAWEALVALVNPDDFGLDTYALEKRLAAVAADEASIARKLLLEVATAVDALPKGSLHTFTQAATALSHQAWIVSLAARL